MTSNRSLRADVSWGVKWGLWFAGGYSLIALALFILQGTVVGQPSRFTLPVVIAFYWAAGIISGAIVGVLKPFARSRFGAITVGALVGTFVYFLAGLTVLGPSEFLSMPGVVSTLIIGPIIGGACGSASLGKDRGLKL